ncbi:MAG: septal ring lytic transglycosylase RlpA family protein [Cyanobacteriota bacterium]|nr:septal ring lytic transglycosylase RlpA family protein [Cyanobacteriota bacterium]
MNQQLWNSLAVTGLVASVGFVSTQPALSQTTSEEIVTLSFSTSSIAEIEAHELDGQRAAILYVRNLPVLTFLESPTSQMGEASLGDPTVRAMEVATRLNQLAQDDIEAQTIEAHWDGSGDRYSIRVGSEVLVELDSHTLLADSTFNPEEDALQAANRLRRLLGNAAPLEAIAGKSAAEESVGEISEMTPAEPQLKKPEPYIVQETQPEPDLFQIDGWASWYGPGFNGNHSASGEIFDQYAMTAAHRDLPFNTLVRVTNIDNGRSVVVRINDRGPFIHGRVIDLSMGAAEEIGMVSSGTAPVQLEVLEPDWSAPHK